MHSAWGRRWRRAAAPTRESWACSLAATRSPAKSRRWACPACGRCGRSRRFQSRLRRCVLPLRTGGLTWEERVLECHFCKNTSDRPHVDGRRVVLGAQQDLGRAVPQRHHLPMCAFGISLVRQGYHVGNARREKRGYLVRVCAEWHADGSGEAKVGQLQHPVLVNQH